ncbi:putative reverse transcriptase domain-containing protein [Tanacetum coccineum]
MSNIEKLKFPALDITGANYIQWTGYVKRHLKSMGALATIQEGNKCTEETKAKADVFLHQHIDEMLEFEYSNCDDPSTLWKDLEIRFNNQREVLLPSARDEWNNLRFCGQTVTEGDMLEKTFSTFHASNINLQQQYRLQNFKRYSDLNVNLLVAEKNNELLMKNHQSRPTGSLALPEANVINNIDNKNYGSKRGRVKEITFTMLHKLIISIRKIMKLVPPKITKDPVSGVEVEITGLKLVSRTIENKKYLHIINENQVFEKLPMLHSGLHYTHINVPQAHMAVKEKYCDPGIFSLWHDRLGHPGSTMMKRIVENTHGHPLKDQRFSKMDKVPLCTSCSLGKLIVRPSPLKIENESPMFLERIQELDTTVRQRTEEFEVRFEEAHDDRAYLNARVNSLYKDWPYHRHTALTLDREAVATLIARTSLLQTRLTTILGRIATLEARDPEPQDGPADTGSSTIIVWRKIPPRRTTRTTPVTTATPTTTVTDAQLQALINQGVAAALAERDASRSKDGDNSHGSGTGGRRQVKFASCTLQGSALTWWNSHVRAVRQDVTYTMPWAALKRMITDKYCPRGEIKKLESEYWNLKVRGTDLMTYKQRFQELALICDRMFPEESAKVERYVGGLPDMIHGSVMPPSSVIARGIEYATEMDDKKNDNATLNVKQKIRGNLKIL